MSLLRAVGDDGLMFWCPGCKRGHMIKHGSGTGPRWSWNGSVDQPTFQPSILARWTEPSDKDEEFDDVTKDIQKVCHSFVTDGRIQFLGDCTHELAGKTVPIPVFNGPYA